MEDILETDEHPYDAYHPVIGMDEQPVQLIKEARQPIVATKAKCRYERAGTASIFMFTEPRVGWRETTAKQSGLGI